MWKWIIGFIGVVFSIYDASMKAYLTKSCFYSTWCFFGDLICLYLLLTNRKGFLSWYFIFAGISIILYLLPLLDKKITNKFIKKISNENAKIDNKEDEIPGNNDHD